MPAKQVYFKIQGDFVTQTALETCHENYDLAKAMRILTECLQNDELTPLEIEHIAMDILNGIAAIVGTYPGDDYGVEYFDDKEDSQNIADTITKLNNKLSKTEAEFDNLIQKYNFLVSHMSEQHSFTLKCIADDYETEYDEPMFEKETTEAYSLPPMTDGMSKILQEYVAQQTTTRDTSEDYGWLEPNGTYHPVEWGLHQEWADDYCKEHDIENTHTSSYNILSSGDILMYQLHWVLIDSPSCGYGNHRYDPSHPLTKSQKEFLFDYYVKQGRNNEASKLYDN